MCPGTTEPIFSMYSKSKSLTHHPISKLWELFPTSGWTMCAVTVNPVKTSRNSTSVAVRTIAQTLTQKLKEFVTPSVSGEREYPFLFRVVFNMLLVAAIAAGFPCPVHVASTSTEEIVDANAALFCRVDLATTSATEPADVKGLSTPSDPLLVLNREAN